jgi:hypothetical protein
MQSVHRVVPELRTERVDPHQQGESTGESQEDSASLWSPYVTLPLSPLHAYTFNTFSLLVLAGGAVGAGVTGSGTLSTRELAGAAVGANGRPCDILTVLITKNSVHGFTSVYIKMILLRALIKPPMPYITSLPLCLLRGFAF